MLPARDCSHSRLRFSLRVSSPASVPLSNGRPSLLVAVGMLLLVGYALKIIAWRRLFAVGERPHPLALVAANAGASILGVVLPGRLADLLRIAIVRRSPSCPAGVRRSACRSSCSV